MLVRIGICLVGAVMALLSLSCAKLPEPGMEEKGLVALEELRDVGSIPAEFGSLISVTNSPKAPTWFQLWFQDEDGNVRMLNYSSDFNNLHQQVRLFHRK
jgi:hypothetical protein